MKSKTLASAVRVLSLLLLVSGTCALAQERRPVHFSGLINDYSPLGPNYQRQPIRNAWSMVNGRQPGMGHRRLLSGYDDVRLWKPQQVPSMRRQRGEALTRTTSVDERQDHLGHDRLPHIPHPPPKWAFS